MDANVKALPMGPFRSSHRHGPPLLGRVQGCPCSPTSSLVCSPPTPCLPRPPLRFPLWWPTSWRALVLCLMRPTSRAPAHVPCVGDGSPALRSTGMSARRGEGLPGYRAILFVRAVVEHPAGYGPLLAQHAGSHYCLRCHPALSASGKTLGFGAAVPRPARSRAYASPMAFLPPSQGWLPARAGSPLAGRVSHPLDDRQNFMKASHPPIPIDPQGLVALDFKYL